MNAGKSVSLAGVLGNGEFGVGVVGAVEEKITLGGGGGYEEEEKKCGALVFQRESQDVEKNLVAGKIAKNTKITTTKGGFV